MKNHVVLICLWATLMGCETERFPTSKVPVSLLDISLRPGPGGDFKEIEGDVTINSNKWLHTSSGDILECEYTMTNRSELEAWYSEDLVSNRVDLEFDESLESIEKSEPRIAFPYFAQVPYSASSIKSLKPGEQVSVVQRFEISPLDDDWLECGEFRIKRGNRVKFRLFSNCDLLIEPIKVSDNEYVDLRKMVSSNTNGFLLQFESPWTEVAIP